jgi:hypothetical protein
MPPSSPISCFPTFQRAALLLGPTRMSGRKSMLMIQNFVWQSGETLLIPKHSIAVFKIAGYIPVVAADALPIYSPILKSSVNMLSF